MEKKLMFFLLGLGLLQQLKAQPIEGAFGIHLGGQVPEVQIIESNQRDGKLYDLFTLIPPKPISASSEITYKVLTEKKSGKVFRIFATLQFEKNGKKQKSDASVHSMRKALSFHHLVITSLKKKYGNAEIEKTDNGSSWKFNNKDQPSRFITVKLRSSPIHVDITYEDMGIMQQVGEALLKESLGNIDLSTL